jgi:hypothetical protein
VLGNLKEKGKLFKLIVLHNDAQVRATRAVNNFIIAGIQAPKIKITNAPIFKGKTQ